MKREINARVLKHARLFLERNATVRSVAKKTGWSKTTVSKDLSKRLSEINYPLYIKVSEKLIINKKSGPIRGGAVTAEKWRKKKNGKI